MTSRTLPDGALLRTARPGDEAGILAHIHALARYEREPDAVENTAQMLTDTLGGTLFSLTREDLSDGGSIQFNAIR